jgi:penicillin amidase
LLLGLLDSSAVARAETNETALSEEENNARTLLAVWDGNETPDSVPAALFQVWSNEFLRATIKDELGDTLFQAYAAWSSLAIRALEYLTQHPASPWFDDRATPAIETASDIALKSFRQTLQFFHAQLGDLMGDWQWGKIHQLSLEHALGKQPPFNQIFNAGPFPCGGSPDTINKGEYRLTAPFAVNAGPSVRRIVDLAHPDAAWSIIPGGQSGQVFSDHYKDQVDLWLQGKYRQVTLNRDRIAAASESILILQPR